jgi:hypothetical protein
MDLEEIRRDGVDWNGLARDRDKGKSLVNVLLDIRAP